MQSKINQVENAISRGDVDFLFTAYKLSLQEEFGKKIRKIIEKNIGEIARTALLPPASSFRELVDNYDRRRFQEILQRGDEDEIKELISELQNSRGERNATLIGEAAFESDEYLPSIGHAAILLVELVKKLGSFEKLKEYLSKYTRVYEPGRIDFDLSPTEFNLIRRIVALLAKENEKLRNVFERAFGEINNILEVTFRDRLRLIR